MEDVDPMGFYLVDTDGMFGFMFMIRGAVALGILAVLLALHLRKKRKKGKDKVTF